MGFQRDGQTTTTYFVTILAQRPSSYRIGRKPAPEAELRGVTYMACAAKPYQDLTTSMVDDGVLRRPSGKEGVEEQSSNPPVLSPSAHFRTIEALAWSNSANPC